jgi:hypothetical protein
MTDKQQPFSAISETVLEPYEPQSVHDRIRRLLAARPPKKG